MIDNPDQTERLLAKLDAALPVPARMTPELAATLQARGPAQSRTITKMAGSYVGSTMLTRATAPPSCRSPAWGSTHVCHWRHYGTRCAKR